jgi:hypothetical protein
MLEPFGNLVTFGICCGNLVYVVAIWYMLWQFGICCGNLVYVVAIWYMLWQFGICFGSFGTSQEKSANPATRCYKLVNNETAGLH